MKKETIDYRNEFNRQMYDRIGLMLPKGMKAEWQAEAKQRNLSLNKFIEKAVLHYINCTEAEQLCNERTRKEKSSQTQ